MNRAATLERQLSPRTRRIVLTAHIAASVGLLGDVAGFLAIAIRAATTPDPALEASSYELLSMFGMVFGIPLTLTSIATGVALGLGTKWGVLRYPWVTTKLVLNVSVLLVGALVLGPSIDEMRTGDGDAGGLLIAGAAYDVVVLTLATTLSVFKPGRARARFAGG
jgi:uncharacterized membrane protein